MPEQIINETIRHKLEKHTSKYKHDAQLAEIQKKKKERGTGMKECPLLKMIRCFDISKAFGKIFGGKNNTTIHH